MRFITFLIASVAGLGGVLAPAFGGSEGAPAAAPDLLVIHRIKAEAFEHSRVMDHLFRLTDVNGPRVTNSPGYRRAAEWCLKQLKEYGLKNVHGEPFEFGKGWSFSHYSANLVAPAPAPLVGFPLAWTPGTNGPVTAEAIYAVMKEEKDFKKFKGKLKGKIVLIDEPRKIKVLTVTGGERYSAKELAERAEAGTPGKRRHDREKKRAKRIKFSKKLFKFLNDEGVVAVFRTSYKGDAGLVAGSRYGSRKADMPVPPTAIALMAEHYDRLVRLLKKKIPVKVELNVEAKIYGDDLNPPNVIAEIPGTRKPDEVVMLGGHLDSWQGGTGAVDNGAGAAVMMEAIRILKALDLKMDRTVRLALWGGEEEGLLGSKAYVKKHFADPETMKVTAEHEQLSAYYNFDNGSGKIRGIYLQNNDMVRPVFEAWLRPFHDLGATVVTIRNTGGTDHLSFDAVGLPGFQFIQDPLDYESVTHHTNADTYGHAIESDLIESAAIIASFVYDTANYPILLPRKPLPKPKPKNEDKKSDENKPTKKES